jgi:hypothetical protein
LVRKVPSWAVDVVFTVSGGIVVVVGVVVVTAVVVVVTVVVVIVGVGVGVVYGGVVAQPAKQAAAMTIIPKIRRFFFIIILQ